MVRGAWAIVLLLAAVSCDCGSQLISNHPLISVDPEAVNFGEVAKGSSPPQVSLTVRNPGDALLLVRQTSIEGMMRFQLIESPPGTLGPNASAPIIVEASTAVVGTFNARLHIESNAENASPLDVPLTIRVVTPDAGPPDAGPPDAGPSDAGPPDAGPPDAGPPDAGPRDAGMSFVDGGEQCGAATALPAVTAVYSSTLTGHSHGGAACGTGPAALFSLTVPPGASEMDFCVRSTAFSPLVHVMTPCGVQAPVCLTPPCCISDSQDAPCDGRACSRWGGPTAGTTVFYFVTGTCADACACPTSGVLDGPFTIEVTVR